MQRTAYTTNTGDTARRNLAAINKVASAPVRPTAEQRAAAERRISEGIASGDPAYRSFS